MNFPESSTAHLHLEAAERAYRRATGRGLDEIAVYIHVRAVHAASNERARRQLAPFGLTPVGYFAMMALFGRPENLANPSDLSDATGETRPSVTRICDELVAKGWMNRVHNPEDRRRVDLSLTKEGEELLRKIAPQLRQAAGDFYTTLFSDSERRTLESLLARFSAALSA